MNQSSHNCCGGEHNHHHGHHHKHGGCNCHENKKASLNETEIAFLKKISSNESLPVSQFVLNSTKSSHLNAVALAPVYLENKDDSMEQVKQIGEMINNLEAQDFILIDYDAPLDESIYEMHFESLVYKHFENTVKEAKALPNFLFDTGSVECGSIVLTDRGNQVIG